MVSAEKQQPLWFSRELFADYRTSLILRVSQNEQCDKVYSGTMPHPLINLQKLNQTQILEYKCTLVAEGLLQHNPIESAETFVNGIKANCSNTAKTRSAVDKVLEIVSRTLSPGVLYKYTRPPNAKFMIQRWWLWNSTYQCITQELYLSVQEQACSH